MSKVSGKYSSITNALGVMALASPGLQEFTPFLWSASKISGAIYLGSQFANIALGGNSYNKTDIAISLTQLFTLGFAKVNNASETSREAIDMIFRLFGIGNDLGEVIKPPIFNK